MRFLIEVRIPTDVGNKGVKDGSLFQQLQRYLKESKPEAVYYALREGRRTVFLIVNVQGAEQLPALAEPMWLDWQAEVFATPVITADEFEKAAPRIQAVVQARK